MYKGNVFVWIWSLWLRACLYPPDEDEESTGRRVPLSPLDQFFSDDESLKEQKKKKPAKLKEGKMPKVKKKKKEVSCEGLIAYVVLYGNMGGHQPWSQMNVLSLAN